LGERLSAPAFKLFYRGAEIVRVFIPNVVIVPAALFQIPLKVPDDPLQIPLDLFSSRLLLAKTTSGRNLLPDVAFHLFVIRPFNTKLHSVLLTK